MISEFAFAGLAAPQNRNTHFLLLQVSRPRLNEFYIYGSTAAGICLAVGVFAARGKLMNFLCKCRSAK